MLSKEFMNMEVFDARLRKIGKVKDVEIELDTLQVINFIIELENDAAKEILGEKPMFKKSIAKVSRSLIEKIGDVIVLKNSVDELKSRIEKLEAK